jgi:SAM-dependent methyltransferase
MPEHTAADRANELRAAVRQRYAAVAREPRGQFPYPVGLESLARLGYAPESISGVPRELAARFVGVGNPFVGRLPRPGERVLDVGCGCGVDTFIAARLVGPAGRSVGLDATPEMLDWPRNASVGNDGCAPEFVEGSVEDLPFEDRSFDVVISNGALNLATDKDRAFSEIARVLVPGGEMVVADLIVRETIPEEVLASMDAWSA